MKSDEDLLRWRKRLLGDLANLKIAIEVDSPDQMRLFCSDAQKVLPKIMFYSWERKKRKARRKRK